MSTESDNIAENEENPKMLTFKKCVEDCLATPDFVQEFDRLGGCHLMTKKPRNAIEAMVDEATGFGDQQLDLDMHKFIAFVYETVWLRLPAGAKDPTQKVSPPAGKSFAELMEQSA